MARALAHSYQSERMTGAEVVRKRKVSMRPLKQFASEKLPIESELGQVLLEMKDEVSVEEFVDLVPVFIRLSRIEQRKDGE